MFKSLVSRATKDSISRNHNAIASFAFSSRCAHSLSFATVEAEEVSGSRPAEVLHLVQGKWVGSSNWNTIADPLNGDSFIKVAEVDETGIQPFIKSLSSCPKHGVHNPFKAPERSKEKQVIRASWLNINLYALCCPLLETVAQTGFC